ncbi:serine/threonine-protein kinase [Streptomyces sp. NPDC001404]|uniref:serine/threonine-protein kinase n=1 Tax=Streptomyces sp. NPDC001404 TaxID=3364571 RepID=UPI00368689A3
MSGEPGAGRLLAGRYRLLDGLGQGGMGTVWRARDEVLDRDVAVKEVRAPDGMPDEEVRTLYIRLEREGRAAARVAHRNVVGVHDVITEDGRPWIVMELVRGLSLAEILEAEGPLTPARTAHIGAEVLAALRAAHAVGVLHRDVKPGNVLVSNDGRVVLTDFGIATVAGSSTLTTTGQLLGSPEFLAPERALGGPPGPESDLWSLGVTLYAAVEGYSPFRQDTALSTLRAVVDQELPPPRRAGGLAPVLEGLLRKDPRLRMGAEEAAHLLRTAAAGGAPRAVPAAYAPTVVAPPPPEPPQEPGPATTTAVPAQPRRGRAVLLVAGVLVAAFAVGGLVWALADRGSSGNEGKEGSTSSAGSSAPGDDGNSGNTETPSGGKSASPGASVGVALTAVRDHYNGPCPPPDAAAPSFTAALTVTRAPVDVVYRWVTDSGGGDWQTVRFADTRPRVVQHAETGRSSGKGWVAVEVKSPQQVTSRHVSFTLTCRATPPTSGTPSAGSSGPTSSASPSAGPATGYTSNGSYGSGGR